MKHSRILSHDGLVDAVISRLRERLPDFRPDVKVIKGGIEALIDREYIEIDPDQGFYKYLP